MSRIVQPIVSPLGRIVILSLATVWLLAAMMISPGAESEAAQLPLPLASLTRVSEMAGLSDPLYKVYSLATTASGDLLITDTGNSRVIRVRHDAPDSPVAVYGAPGQGPGEMVAPRGVAVDADDNVFVADSSLGRITKFAPDGAYLASVSHPFARNLMVDSAGRVLVWPGDFQTMLYRYDNDLENQEAVLAKPDPDKQKAGPDALFALDDQDRLYWLDQDELVVRVYDRDFEPIDEWRLDAPGLREDVEVRLAEIRELLPTGGLNPIKHLAIGTGGDLLMTYKESRGTAAIFVYSPDGQLRRSLRGFDGSIHAATVVASGELVTSDSEGYELFDLLSSD